MSICALNVVNYCLWFRTWYVVNCWYYGEIIYIEISEYTCIDCGHYGLWFRTWYVENCWNCGGIKRSRPLNWTQLKLKIEDSNQNVTFSFRDVGMRNVGLSTNGRRRSISRVMASNKRIDCNVDITNFITDSRQQ